MRAPVCFSIRAACDENHTSRSSSSFSSYSSSYYYYYYYFFFIFFFISKSNINISRGRIDNYAYYGFDAIQLTSTSNYLVSSNLYLLSVLPVAQPGFDSGRYGDFRPLSSQATVTMAQRTTCCREVSRPHSETQEQVLLRLQLGHRKREFIRTIKKRIVPKRHPKKN